jgi:hypothetical protein
VIASASKGSILHLCTNTSLQGVMKTSNLMYMAFWNIQIKILSQCIDKFSAWIWLQHIFAYELLLERNIAWDFTVLYIGESEIICTIGTCFAVGYTASWAWQNTHGLLLSYHCGAGVTLIVHFCHEFFCHKHGHSQFHLHQIRTEGSDPFLWAEGVPGVEMHRMMSVQYGYSVMSQWIVC